jgi:hypothetical protein
LVAAISNPRFDRNPTVQSINFVIPRAWFWPEESLFDCGTERETNPEGFLASLGMTKVEGFGNLEALSYQNLEEFMPTSSWHSIGLYVQLAGAGAFIAGAALSLQHVAIALCFVGGAAAFYAGKKLKAF